MQSSQLTTFWPVLGAGHGNGVIDSQEVHSLLRVFFDRTLRASVANQNPVARVIASVTSGVAPLSVSLDGSSSNDPDGVITKYSWSSCDGLGGSNQGLAVIYTRPGIYPATLSVRDEPGARHSSTVLIIVAPAGTPSATPPTAIVSEPLADAVYTPTGDFLIEATVSSAPETPVSSVEFFLQGSGLSEQVSAWDSRSPYNHTAGGLPPGNYQTRVRTSDVNGASSVSAAAPFAVLGEQFRDGFE